MHYRVKARAIWGLILALFLGLAGGWRNASAQTASAPAPQDDPHVVLGSMTATATGPARCREFVNASGGQLLQCNKDALWFWIGGTVCRYNVKSGAFDVETTVFTHASLRSYSHTALAADGRFVISGFSTTYLWTPGKGWSRLPQPDGVDNEIIPGFAPDGGLWAFQFHRAWSWKDGAWTHSVPAQGAGLGSGAWFAALDDGWFSGSGSSQNWYPLSLDAKQRKPLKEYDPKHNLYPLHVQAPKGLITASAEWGTRTLTLCRVTKESIIEVLPASRFAGMDAATGDVFELKASEDTTKLAVRSTDGKLITEIPAAGIGLNAPLLFIRDANGHYWLQNRRWDGKSWQVMMPENGFAFTGNLVQAVTSGRLQFDEKAKTWVDTWKGVPEDVQAFDVATRRGWVSRNPTAYSADEIWDLFEFPADGKPKLERTVTVPPMRYRRALPTVRDSAGHWWFGSNRRWDGQKLHVYDDGSATRTEQSAQQGDPRLILSPKGNLWMYQVRRTWKRYDAAADRFVDDLPYDDFAFALGGQTVATVGWQADVPSAVGKDEPGMVHIKVDGKWQPLPSRLLALNLPPGTNNYGVHYFFSRGRVASNGDSLLVSSPKGIFEWDARNDRWSYLVPFGDAIACYDVKGRRVIVSGRRIILLEGEVFDKSSQAEAELREELQSLLVKMNDPKRKVRDAASDELASLARRDREAVAHHLSWRLSAATPLPPEVRARVVALVSELTPKDSTPEPNPREPGFQDMRLMWRAKAGNSLLERACRPLVPSFPGGCALKVGMDWETARSILCAAGVEYHYGGGNGDALTFLLPDNTAIYIRVDKQRTNKITSLGLGQKGKGRGDWDWFDPQKNGLESVELKPSVAWATEW